MSKESRRKKKELELAELDAKIAIRNQAKRTAETMDQMDPASTEFTEASKNLKAIGESDEKLGKNQSEVKKEKIKGFLPIIGSILTIVLAFFMPTIPSLKDKIMKPKA